MGLRVVVYSGYFSCCVTEGIFREERFIFACSFKGRIVTVWKVWHQELETDGHIVSTFRKQTRMNSRAPFLLSFFPLQDSSQWNVVKSTFSVGLPSSVTLLWKPPQICLIRRWLSNAVKMTIKINHHCVCLEGVPQKAVSYSSLEKNGFGIRKSGLMLKYAIWLKCPPSVKWGHGTQPVSSPHLWNKVPLQFLVGCIKLLKWNLWGDWFYSFFFIILNSSL